MALCDNPSPRSETSSAADITPRGIWSASDVITPTNKAGAISVLRRLGRLDVVVDAFRPPGRISAVVNAMSLDKPCCRNDLVPDVTAGPVRTWLLVRLTWSVRR